jgi:hypothetical protein
MVQIGTAMSLSRKVSGLLRVGLALLSAAALAACARSGAGNGGQVTYAPAAGTAIARPAPDTAAQQHAAVPPAAPALPAVARPAPEPAAEPPAPAPTLARPARETAPPPAPALARPLRETAPPPAPAGPRSPLSAAARGTRPPAPPPAEPDAEPVTPETIKQQCWMEADKDRRVRDLDRRAQLVDDCVKRKMKDAQLLQ